MEEDFPLDLVLAPVAVATMREELVEELVEEVA
jgi:hypothetical protein